MTDTHLLADDARRLAVPAPGPLLGPLYALRASVTGADFSYEQNRLRLHFGAVLDGRLSSRRGGGA